MRHRRILVSLALLLPGLLSAGVSLSEEPSAGKKGQMVAVLRAFEDLQAYIASRDAFMSPSNESRITEDLKKMRAGFHSLEAINSRLRREPGFSAGIVAADDTLAEISKNLREGNKLLALHDLKGVTSLCITCHATHHVSLSFSDAGGTDTDRMSPFERGEYFFATRQFKRAEEAYLDAAASPGGQRMPSLRRWLALKIRSDNAPGEALAGIDRLLEGGKLAGAEERELRSWRASLAELPPAVTESEDHLAAARTLITAGVSLTPGDPAVNTDYVKLLAASALLHAGFEKGEFSKERRAEALYLLGVSYARLGGRFLDDLPEIFLAQCIDEFPDSAESRKSYLLYEELVNHKYQGVPPDEVSLKLRELYARAYGVPDFKTRI